MLDALPNKRKHEDDYSNSDIDSADEDGPEVCSLSKHRCNLHFFWWLVFIIYHGIYLLYQVPGMDPSKKKSKASYEAWKSSVMTAKGTTKLAAGKK